MTPSLRERRILRGLAHQVAEIGALPEQAERIRLWTACNDLEPERAVVFADPQNGWSELDRAWLRLECEDATLREFEFALRRKIIRHQHINDDFPILPTLAIPIKVTGDGYDDYGLALGVTRPDQPGGAYQIDPVIGTEGDIDRLHFRPIHIDHVATDRAVGLASELLGDILKVEKQGKVHWRYGLTRVLVHMRGLDQMMIDLYDNPEVLHRLMAFLRDDYAREIDLFERADAVSLNAGADIVNGTGGLSPTCHLPKNDYDGVPRAKHCICWGESQETGVVGPDQFLEFVLRYQLPLLRRFGLVAYGCCEPLDHKLDLLIQGIPNLRWVAVPAWADRELAADSLGRRHVYVYKPNPAYICTPSPNWEEAEREVRETLRIASGCAVHVVMKDTHTFCHEPERITRWTETASRIVRELA
jgi:hypothetical protein